MFATFDSTTHKTLLGRLGSMIQSSKPGSETVATARRLVDEINSKKAFLKDNSHTILYVGSVGVGKSSLICVATGLLVGPAPNTRQTLKESALLATGSGRTTVCEVQIRSAMGGEAALGLRIDPFSQEEMENEITFFAEEEWKRCQPDEQNTDDNLPTIPVLAPGLIGHGKAGLISYP